jgi:hypothetical protein
MSMPAVRQIVQQCDQKVHRHQTKNVSLMAVRQFVVLAIHIVALKSHSALLALPL